jgi:uncharacterized protein (DUF1684 family)
MNSDVLKSVLFTGTVSLLLFSCQKNLTPYETEITAQRQQKNDSFLNGGPASPLREEDKADFSGLKYFDVDSMFRVQAVLKKLTVPTAIVMATSTGVPRNGFKIADAQFSIKGTSLSVPVYMLENRKGEMDSTYYFIPFTDKTSGKESYPNGRYLDIHGPIADGELFLLDFNVAYNPLCNYSDKYSCSIPPKESFIDFEITAGEKNFH